MHLIISFQVLVMKKKVKRGKGCPCLWQEEDPALLVCACISSLTLALDIGIYEIACRRGNIYITFCLLLSCFTVCVTHILLSQTSCIISCTTNHGVRQLPSSNHFLFSPHLLIIKLFTSQHYLPITAADSFPFPSPQEQPVVPLQQLVDKARALAFSVLAVPGVVLSAALVSLLLSRIAAETHCGRQRKAILFSLSHSPAVAALCPFFFFFLYLENELHRIWGNYTGFGTWEVT